MPDGDPRIGNSWEALGRALYREQKAAEAVAALEKAEFAYGHAGAVWAAKASEIRQMIDQIKK